jgi:hypothetical protein
MLTVKEWEALTPYQHRVEGAKMIAEIDRLKAELEDFKRYNANASDQCVEMQSELKSARAELAEARDDL